MSERVSFTEAGQVARAANRRANAVKLSVRDRKVLAAVIDLTATYSKIADRVYLAQVAAVAFGVDEAPPWMCEKARKSLRVLHEGDVVYSQAPRGRSWGRQYVISLVPLGQVTQPEDGPTDSDVTQPDAGLTDSGNAAQDEAESRSVTQPEFGCVTQPEPGGPTEKSSEVTPPTSNATTHEDDGELEPKPQPRVTRRRLWATMAERQLALQREADWSDMPPPGSHRESRYLEKLRTEFELQHNDRVLELRDRFPVDDLERWVYELDPNLSKHGYGPGMALGQRYWDEYNAEQATREPLTEDELARIHQRTVEAKTRIRAMERERRRREAVPA